MFDFERISLKQILNFSEIVGESSLLQKEFIKARYLETSLNFENTVEFLQKLKLIDVRGNDIVLASEYRAFLKEFNRVREREVRIKTFILTHLLNQRGPFSEDINEFLSHFRFVEDQFEFAPSSSQRLKYSGVRNFFMDLEFLYLHSDEPKYIISDEYSITYAGFKGFSGISVNEFWKLQQKKEEIGKAAELQIIKYEKDRLSEDPLLAQRIEHTAMRDVIAGYDIKSFDGKFDEDGNPIPRYIEVKAVPHHSYKFFWTRNEIEKSNYHRNRYYLYLLPVLNKRTFGINALKIIKDPYSSVYQKGKEWTRTEELLAFSLAKTSTV